MKWIRCKDKTAISGACYRALWVNPFDKNHKRWMYFNGITKEDGYVDDIDGYMGSINQDTVEWLDESLSTETGQQGVVLQWKLKLAEVTGAVLGCRKVLMDYEITQDKAKSIGEKLGNIAEELRLLVNQIKTI